MTALATETPVDQANLDLVGLNQDLRAVLEAHNIADPSIAARHIVQGNEVIGVTFDGLSLFPAPQPVPAGGAS